MVLFIEMQVSPEGIRRPQKASPLRPLEPSAALSSPLKPSKFRENRMIRIFVQIRNSQMIPVHPHMQK